MFKKIEPLENSKHRDLRFSKARGFGFAKNISAVQLSFSELRFASRFYPIIFPADGRCIPQALISLDDKSIAEIVRTGTMGFVYEHLQSISNIAFLAKSK